MYITKCVVIFVLHYTIVWINKISPCIGEGTLSNICICDTIIVLLFIEKVFANGSVTVDEDTAILTLAASVNGTFQCKLDNGSFHACRCICGYSLCVYPCMYVVQLIIALKCV